MATLPDGRAVPPAYADERPMLMSWLDFHRATLALKCEGLDDRQVRTASVALSEMTLLGLVQHAAEVERNWFRRIFGGKDLPPVYAGEGREDGFALVTGRGRGAVAPLDLVHMIEEYARHNGHADLLREGIVGVTGS
ncbi:MULTISPECIES: DinB family protein [unclassified Streptomyces]|uniref:DinB family protein n=1 Tax=unclassified Streptomyces TaxID=2593676 RepID=UPI000CDA202C|nr:DinB family protein [Streptomyces sp. SM10]